MWLRHVTHFKFWKPHPYHTFTDTFSLSLAYVISLISLYSRRTSTQPLIRPRCIFCTWRQRLLPSRRYQLPVRFFFQPSRKADDFFSATCRAYAASITSIRLFLCPSGTLVDCLHVVQEKKSWNKQMTGYFGVLATARRSGSESHSSVILKSTKDC